MPNLSTFDTTNQTEELSLLYEGKRKLCLQNMKVI